MFQSIGYMATPKTTDRATALASAFPLIKDDLAALRQWTIRTVSPYPHDNESDSGTKEEAGKC
jgi:hypothetical protein